MRSILFAFAFDVTFSGKVTDGQKKIKGTFEIPNLSEENEAHEIVVSYGGFHCAQSHMACTVSIEGGYQDKVSILTPL